tara:strand:- start:497 stop:982 length:486 start_codon:yes stop_codon:yes gene_type:complete
LHAEILEHDLSLSHGEFGHHGYGLLAEAWGLPDLGSIMPDIIRVQEPDHIARPGPNEVRASLEKSENVACAPVVANQVDRTARSKALHLPDQPVTVSLPGGSPVLWNRGTETRWRQEDHVVDTPTGQFRHQLSPDGVRLRIAMNHGDGHGYFLSDHFLMVC